MKILKQFALVCASILCLCTFAACNNASNPFISQDVDDYIQTTREHGELHAIYKDCYLKSVTFTTWMKNYDPNIDVCDAEGYPICFYYYGTIIEDKQTVTIIVNDWVYVGTYLNCADSDSTTVEFDIDFFATK